jgi:hypothetical protein
VAGPHSSDGAPELYVAPGEAHNSSGRALEPYKALSSNNSSRALKFYITLDMLAVIVLGLRSLTQL